GGARAPIAPAGPNPDRRTRPPHPDRPSASVHQQEARHVSTSTTSDHPAPRMSLPERDHSQAVRTGLTRAHWDAVAEDLLLALRPWASEDGALILPPGRSSHNGTRSDGLEGFARSFLLAALLLTGRNGDDPQGHAERYAY